MSLNNALQNWYTRTRVPRRVAPRVKYDLKTHQQLVRNYMKTHKRLLAVHGTGSGKTLLAAHVGKDFLDADPSNNIVIYVTPNAVSRQFKNSVGTVMAGRPGVYFATYDNVVNFLKQQFYTRRENFTKIMNHAMIIADEAHYITEGTRKSDVFYSVFKSASKILLMTGTPIANGQDDLLPYAKLLNPSKPIGVADIRKQDFSKFFECKVSVYTTPSNSSNFPTIQGTYRTNLTLTNNQANRLLRTKTLRNAKGWALNRSMEVSTVFPNVSNSPKFQKFLEIYRERPHKTIVFFKEYKPLEKFKMFLRLHSIPYREVTGQTKNKASALLNDPVRTSKTVYLLTSAAKEGLDFKGVRTVVFMDFPWVPSDYNQVVGRARRYKSHVNLNIGNRNVKIYELVYKLPNKYTNKSTINTRSTNLLRSKRAEIERLMTILVSVSIEARPSCATHMSPSPNRPNVRRPNNPATIHMRFGSTRIPLSGVRRIVLRPNRIAILPGNTAIDPVTKRRYHLSALNTLKTVKGNWSRVRSNLEILSKKRKARAVNIQNRRPAKRIRVV